MNKINKKHNILCISTLRLEQKLHINNEKREKIGFLFKEQIIIVKLMKK